MFQKAKRFEFSYYKAFWKEQKLQFGYTVVLENGEILTFQEELFLPAAVDIAVEHLLESILQSLHLILGISYYKLWCPSDIAILGNSLTEEQAEFWNTVYTKGLGEFFYKNKIDYRGLVKFPYEISSVIPAPGLPVDRKAGIYIDPRLGSGMSKKALVPIGGGKDSIVTAELFKKGGYEFAITALNVHPLQQQISKAIGVPSIGVRRELDPKLFDLVKADDVYDGHIPISAIYAFVNVLLAMVYDYKYIAVSNERSSDYGNIEYLGQTVNHQWSKSQEFEDLFRNYIQKFIAPDVAFFSMLRPFYEIEIVRRFCSYPQYFHLFSSCNRNFKIREPLKDKRWCCECEKCAFVFSLMSAFLPKSQVIKIFDDNLFAKKSLVDTYRELLGIKNIKPFECVGTPEEVKVAFHMAHEKGEYTDDRAMKMFVEEVDFDDKQAEADKSQVFSYGNDKNIPDEFKRLLT